MKPSALLRSRVVCGLLAATLTVLTMSGCGGGWGSAKPTIATQSTGQSAGQGAQAQTVTAGQPATFSVTPAGTGPFTYQWYVNGVAINGAVSSSYTVAATTSGDNGSLYTVAVTNAAGTIVSAPFVLTVNTPPSLSVQPVSETVIAGQPATFSVTATGTAPINYQWYQGTTPISGATGPTYTTPATAVGDSGATYTVVVTNVVGTISSPAATLTVTPLVPTLSFAPIATQTYGGAPFIVSATSASSGAVSYSVGSGPATIVGNTVTLTGAGTVVLNASQVVNGNYTAATATTKFTVGDEVPTLTLPSPGTKIYGQQQPFAVTATSNSPGAITYSVVSGPATITGNTIALTGMGTVVLNVSQAASGNYTATTATASFTVDEVPTLSFTPIATQTYGNGPILVTATSNSPGAITYSVSGPATIAGNTVTLTGVGTVNLSASQVASGNYTATTATASFTVNPETPTLSFTPIAAQTYSTTPFAVQAISNSPGAITYSWVSGPATVSGNMVTMTGAAEVELQANQAASGGFGAGTATTTFNITAAAPVITVQPVSANICLNQTLTLSVTATNATFYQWNLNGTPISGATNATYTLGTATASANQNYTVTVSNPTDSVTSQVATVNVGSTIVTNPSNLTITEYQEGSFNVAASGSGHYTYQWYSGAVGSGSLISGATSDLYVTPVQTTPTTSSYYAQVTDTSCGATLTSGQATLTVDAGNSPPTITVQPQGQTVTAGDAATFTATAVGSGTISYQWYVIPNGGTNAEIAGTVPAAGNQVTTGTGGTASSQASGVPTTYTTSSTTAGNDQDVYYVVATNAYGTAVSQHATLAVGAGIQLQITHEPVNQYVNAGESATFSVTATSTATLNYQWYSVPPGDSAAQQNAYTLPLVDVNGNDEPTTMTVPANAVAIPGATGSSYTVANTTAAQTGTVYYVVVSNDETSQVYSNTAALTVGQPTGITACSTDWKMLGTTLADDCGYELVTGKTYEQGEIVWPTLIPTGNMQLSFTITTSNTSSPPADGFTMTLGDPSLGATLQSIGLAGEGIGAKGIPGFVLAFDDYANPACTSGCYPGPYVADPTSTAYSADPDYLGVGRGEPTLWEDPYFNVNFNLPGLTYVSSASTDNVYPLADYGQTIQHNYAVSIVNGYMSVTMDNIQVFSGNVTVPPVAYLYLTASTGGSYEEVQISNISATINAPSN
jgi:hypothetical protein